MMNLNIGEAIKQEFYETFRIEQSRDCEQFKNWNERNYKIDRCKHFNGNCKKDCPTFDYPPITPEIILGLKAILLDLADFKSSKSEQLHYFISEYTVKGSYAIAIQSKRYDEIIGGYHIIENTYPNALLKLCIQYKDDIKLQVQELFKQKG